VLCPRCARETEERAAFCGACGAPLTLQDEPPPRRLDLTLDLDRRGPRTPPPGPPAAPRPAGVPELHPDLEASDPAPVAPPASRSHWDLGRVLAGAAGREGFSVGPPSPDEAPPAPAVPALPQRRVSAAPAAGTRAPAAAASAAASASATFAWSDLDEEIFPDEVDRVEVHLRRPATWRRAAAWAIDAGPFVGGVVYLGTSLLSTATAGLPAPPVGLDGLLDLLARESDIVLSLAALLALSLAVYATLSHALAGATLGKWMLGLRVVGPDGTRPSLARSAARAALAGASAALLGLGFLLALFTRSGRSLHDLIARTWVVEAP
jgi:uncharacterized RDD family membrane protein YckC